MFENKKRDYGIEAISTNISDLLKDEDKNGIPDFADDIVKQSKNGNQSKTFNKTYININGKTFDNMADATKYATDNVPALKLLKKLVKLDPFINSEINKMDNLVIDGEIIDNKDINHTFDANQQINPNSRNLPKGASKTDLILGLIILALVFVVIFYFIIQ